MGLVWLSHKAMLNQTTKRSRLTQLELAWPMAVGVVVNPDQAPNCMSAPTLGAKSQYWSQLAFHSVRGGLLLALELRWCFSRTQVRIQPSWV